MTRLLRCWHCADWYVCQHVVLCIYISFICTDHDVHAYTHTYRLFTHSYRQLYTSTGQHADFVRIHTCGSYMHTYVHTYVHTYIRTYIHTETDMRRHTYIYTRDTCIYTCMHTCMHERISAYMSHKITVFRTPIRTQNNPMTSERIPAGTASLHTTSMHNRRTQASRNG